MVPTVIPASAHSHTPKRSDLAIVLAEDKAVAYLLEELLSRSNLTIAELAARLGLRPQSLIQYRNRRRLKPSLQWFVRLVEACGGRIVLEMPTQPLQ